MNIRHQASWGVPAKYFNEVVMTYDGEDCLIWPHGTGNGYGILRQDGRNQYVHRLVCRLVHGAPPTTKHESAHSCGNGHLGCVAKRHLSWKTRKGNSADRLTHGTDNRGARNGKVKLTASQVREIFALKGVLIKREIAARYGVSESTVASVHKGQSWGWLNG